MCLINHQLYTVVRLSRHLTVQATTVNVLGLYNIHFFHNGTCMQSCNMYVAGENTIMFCGINRAPFWLINQLGRCSPFYRNDHNALSLQLPVSISIMNEILIENWACVIFFFYYVFIRLACENAFFYLLYCYFRCKKLHGLFLFVCNYCYYYLVISLRMRLITAMLFQVMSYWLLNKKFKLFLVFCLQYYEMSYGLNVEMHKQVRKTNFVYLKKIHLL